jgi:glycosyltransferase involved in cell wall biosynthesis
MISLIMCTIGKREHIPRLIASLRKQERTDFELIIVDQSEVGYLTDLVEQAAAHLDVVYVRSARGLSRARNKGLQRARGEIVAFPDDDCWYPEKTVAQVEELFANDPQLGIATGRTLDSTGRESNGRFLSRSATVTRSNVWLSGNSNAVFARTDVARRLGGFDESLGVGSGTEFGSGEETDFLLRAIAANVKTQFFVDLVVHHDQVDTAYTTQTLNRAVLYAQGFGRVLLLNGYSQAFALIRIVRSFCAALLALTRFRLGLARFKLIWARGILMGYLSSRPQQRPPYATVDDSMVL